MPELPEVERVRLSLAPRLVGRTITHTELRRADVVRGPTNPRDLLRGGRVAGVFRRGKQLAIVTEDGRALRVHLGMTGQLLWKPPRTPPDRGDHVHAVWRVSGDGSSKGTGGRLFFRDPRRFGGLWTGDTADQILTTRWAALGPDALEATPAGFRQAVHGSRRSVKAALLDQTVLAGVGNIYADEALFRARILPAAAAGRLDASACARLVRCVRRVLRESIEAGGSTIRDYVDADGVPGGFLRRRAVYGRAGEPCVRCRTPLTGGVLAQRATVWCAACQR